MLRGKVIVVWCFVNIGVGLYFKILKMDLIFLFCFLGINFGGLIFFGLFLVEGNFSFLILCFVFV